MASEEEGSLPLTQVELDGRTLTVSLTEGEQMRVALIDFIQLAKIGKVKTGLPPGHLERLPANPAHAFIDQDHILRAAPWLLQASGERLGWVYRVTASDGRPAYQYAAWLQREGDRWKVTSISLIKMLRARPR